MEGLFKTKLNYFFAGRWGIKIHKNKQQMGTMIEVGSEVNEVVTGPQNMVKMTMGD